MKKTRDTAEQNAFALWQAELGTPVGEVVRKIGVSRNNSFLLCAPMRHLHEHASTAGRPLRTTIKVRFHIRQSDLFWLCLDLLRDC